MQKLHPELDRILITTEEIQARVIELTELITADYSDADKLYSGYCWFANIKFESVISPRMPDPWFCFETSTFTGESFTVNEPPWPKKTTQCDASRAFIAHPILFIDEGDTLGGLALIIYDHSHGGAKRPTCGLAHEELQSYESPVTYADGHVELHPQDRIKPRAAADCGGRGRHPGVRARRNVR